MQPKPKLVACGAVARLYDVDKSTVRRWCEKGRVKCERTPGGDWRIELGPDDRPIFT